MTMPRLIALNKHWLIVPPACIQLRNIAAVLGIKPAEKPAPQKQSFEENDFNQLLELGFPVFEGRPNDPILDFLD